MSLFPDQQSNFYIGDLTRLWFQLTQGLATGGIPLRWTLSYFSLVSTGNKRPFWCSHGKSLVSWLPIKSRTWEFEHTTLSLNSPVLLEETRYPHLITAPLGLAELHILIIVGFTLVHVGQTTILILMSFFQQHLRGRNVLCSFCARHCSVNKRGKDSCLPGAYIIGRGRGKHQV